RQLAEQVIQGSTVALEQVAVALQRREPDPLHGPANPPFGAVVAGRNEPQPGDGGDEQGDGLEGGVGPAHGTPPFSPEPSEGCRGRAARPKQVRPDRTGTIRPRRSMTPSTPVGAPSRGAMATARSNSWTSEAGRP